MQPFSKKSPLLFLSILCQTFSFFFAGHRQQTGFCFLLSIECRFFMRSFEIAFSECETIKGSSSTWNFSFFHLVVFTCLPAAFDVMQVGVLTSGSLSFIFYSSTLASQQRHFRFVGTERADLISNEISIRLQQVGNDANEKESEERTCWYLERKQTEQHISICFLDEDIFDSSWSHLWSNRNRFKWWKLKRC